LGATQHRETIVAADSDLGPRTGKTNISLYPKVIQSCKFYSTARMHEKC
jgi:hypothetical protein